MRTDLDRNLVFEFAGMPKSGKTTVLDIVSHYMRRMQIPAEEFHGGGRYAPIGKDALPELNLFLAATCLRRLVSFIGYPKGIGPKVYLLDRGPVDRLIFCDALLGTGRLTSAHVDTVDTMFRAPELAGAVTHTFVFVTSPRLSLEREERNKVASGAGRGGNERRSSPSSQGRCGRMSMQVREHPVSTRVSLIDTECLDGSPRETALVVLRHMSEYVDLQSFPMSDGRSHLWSRHPSASKEDPC